MDIALAIATATSKPSWGYMVLQGPGTIWESWDHTTNSQNHPALGATIGTFLYAVAGAEPATWGLGRHRRAVLRPERALGAAEVSLSTPQGRVSFEWASRVGEGSFHANVSTPHGGAGAEVHLLVPVAEPRARLALVERSSGAVLWRGTGGNSADKLESQRAECGVLAVEERGETLVVTAATGAFSFSIEPVP